MSPETVSADAMPVESRPVGHHGQGIPEPSGVELSRVVLAVVAAFVLLAIGIGGLGMWYWRQVPVKTMPLPASFPQPRVAADELTELRQILAAQRRRLTSYQWTNKEHTLVQIPIDRAMKIIVAKGSHAYDPIAANPGASAAPQAAPERALTPSAAPPQQTNSPPPSDAAGGAQ
jgi:hypothetical protein